MKIYLSLFLSFLILGCSASVAGGSASNTKEIEKLIEQKDKKIEKLSKRISDLESKKAKYQEDLETYNNNPVLDELDELLSQNSENNTTGEN